MLVLHHAWRSSASRRVRVCLEEKGLAYEGHVIDLAKMEHHSPEYLKINPNGVIPALIHDLQKVAEKWTDAELEAHLKKIPSKERQEAWRRALHDRKHRPFY